MKLERTKNATRNIFFGIILKLYQTFVPFLMRTAMIYFLGIEYVGLNGVFVSVLQVLNLAELGVGSAIVFSMYKPLAENDTEKICALMQLIKTYYRIIGTVVLVAGLALLPFLPYFIEGEVPIDINIYVIYVIDLAATVLSYFLFTHQHAMFTIHQREDVFHKITIVTNTIQYIIQFLALVIFRNYYVFISCRLVIVLLNESIKGILSYKKYPQYRARGRVSKEERKEIGTRVRDLFTSKIGAVFILSVDTIVISAFLGLEWLGKYNNYHLILASIVGVTMSIFNACMAGIGNSLVLESKEKNFKDFKKFTFLVAWMAGFCSACFLCLYQPFMEIWVGKELQLDFVAVICLSGYFFLRELQLLFDLYKDAAGMWHEDRWRPLVNAFVNLILNLIFVQFWGVYGVLFATVLSMFFISIPWVIKNIFTVIFSKKELGGYLKKLLLYVAVALFTCAFTYLLTWILPLTNVWAIFFTNLAICLIVPNAIFLLVYHRTTEFKESLLLVDRMTKGKLKLSRFVQGSASIQTEVAVQMEADTKVTVDIEGDGAKKEIAERIEEGEENSSTDGTKND